MITYNACPAGSYEEWHGDGTDPRPVHDAVILGVPSDVTGTTATGQRDGPDAIRSGPYDEHDLMLNVPTGYNIVDFGNVDVVPENVSDTGENISGCVLEACVSANLAVVLGGDDGINYWVSQAFDTATSLAAASDRRTRFVLFHFDAHADVYKNPEGEIDHATWLGYAAEHGHFDRCYLFGTRAHGVPVNGNDKIWNLGLEELERIIDAEVLEGSVIMLGVDMDVLDPAFAPGVAVPEPFGMTPLELLDAIELISPHASLLSITEVTPANDANGITALTANRIVSRAIHWRTRSLAKPKKILPRNSNSS